MIDSNAVPYKIRLAESLWTLRSNPEQFRQAVKDMLARCYPGFVPIKTQHPFVLCKRQ